MLKKKGHILFSIFTKEIIYCFFKNRSMLYGLLQHSPIHTYAYLDQITVFNRMVSYASVQLNH